MSNRKPKNRSARRPFSTQLEGLEPRILLAGDTFSPWQNPLNRCDVNQDGHVSPADVLVVRQVLNTQGAHELPARASAEPGSANQAAVLMLDSNGDGYVSPIDALLVIEAVNGQSEGEEFRLRVDVTNGAGDVVSEVNVGDTFTLNAYVQDIRGEDAAGVFSAYLDVTYDASIVSVEQGAAIVHAAPFDDGKSGDFSEPGLIDEAGGFDQSGSGDGTERLLFQLNFVADAVGVVSFDPNPADIVPIHEFLGHDDINAIDPANILFDGVQLTVTGTSAEAVDLAGFAKALDQAGVEFWSTRQFNIDAVAQRELFEDAELYLPFNESFDSNGELNDAANDRNVTEVNTWIFPDESTATGVLSLQELSTRSGVALPTEMGPTLKQVVANDEVDLEFNSPLQLGLDAYDALNGPVTYTVTVDDPSLVESTMIMGNRGWELDIEGYGKMVFEFFEGRAPRATSQFITLTARDPGFYNGLTLHRILNGFVIQGGDPLGDGTGGSDLPDFDDQFNVDLQHNQIGVLSMAKSGDDTNNSQFFVTDATTRHLDFNHTIFGQLIEGFDVLDAVSAVAVNPPASQGVPTVPVVIKSARVIDDQENAIVMLRALGSSGTTNVTVTATDSLGNTDSNTFAVNLIAATQNAEPFLEDIPDYLAAAGTSFEFQLEPVDIENDDVIYDVDVISPAGLTATVSGDGRVTVDLPDTMNDGEEALVRVTISDTPVVSVNTPRDEQVVSILIGDDLVVANDAFTIDEDSGAHVFDVLANDTATGTLTITDVSAPTDGGTVAITGDGKIEYTPSANFPFESTTALDSTFTYTMSGGAGERFAVGKVTVTVNPVNDPPTANDDSFPADFDPVADLDEIRRLREDELDSVKFFVVLNDLVSPDQEIPGISAVFSDTATLGIENLATAVTYVPGANVFGEDTFTYTLSDPGGLSDMATVTVLIAQVNDAPITTDDSIEVLAGRPQTILAADLLGNDSAGPLEDSIQSLSIASVTQPANGTVTLNTDGSLTYTANAGFDGVDSFEYTAIDDGVTENFDDGSNSFVAAADPLTATGVVTVTSTSPMIAVDDTYVVEVGSGDPSATSLDELANDDLTLSPTVTAVGSASNGTVEIINDGNDVAYTPNAGFTGADSFTYTITDSEDATSTATVNVTVQLENMNPTALDDVFTVQSDGTEHSLDVLANDTVEDGETKKVTSILDQPDNGIVRISEFGDAIIYTPDAGFAGTDSLVYQLDDGNGGTDSAQVTITVELANANPTANDDMLTVSGAIQRPLDVLANDETEDGETLTIDSIVTVPTNGVATISSDGQFILYERIDDDVTEDSLVYQISDGNGGLATATVTITVLADNQNPVAQDDTVTISGVQTIDVLANDETELGETLTIDSITADPTQGTATISSDGMSIEYTPNGGATGTDTLTYQVNDGNGGTATANVSMTLDLTNLAPVANDDVIEVSPFGEQTLNVLDNDEGEAGETLTITSTGGTPTGVVAINSDGTGLLYTPASGSAGTTDTFTYTIDDGSGLTAEASVTVNIGTLSNSFFAGVVFQDMDNDGQKSEAEMGIGGVTVVLEGTDLNGESIRMETTTSLLGDYRFENIVPGDYLVSQIQPAFLNSGSNTFGLTVTEDDHFEFQVSEQLIASDNNTFAELGLPTRFAIFDALASSRQPGVFAVLDGDDMAWVENRGGWDDIDSLVLSRDGDDLNIESSAGNGTLSMSARGTVQLLGRSGTYTMLRINGTSEAVLSAAAVDQAFAS